MAEPRACMQFTNSGVLGVLVTCSLCALSSLRSLVAHAIGPTQPLFCADVCHLQPACADVLTCFVEHYTVPVCFRHSSCRWSSC
jgi:hypothetical protein